MTGPERARRMLAATSTNVVAFPPPERDLRHNHLVGNAPVWFGEFSCIPEWSVARSQLRLRDVLSLNIAMQSCMTSLDEAEAKFRRGCDFEIPSALVSMATAARRFDQFGAIVRTGRDRFAAAIMDAGLYA